MLWPLLLCGAASLLVIVRLLHSYGDRRRCAWYVQAAAVASWYLPFTIVFILPFDFSSTLFRTCDQNCDEPVGYISSRFTRDLWAALYWTMYLLTWVVLPLMMSYVDSGAFVFRDRLRDAAWSNLQFYGISGAVGILVVGYIALTRGFFGADLVAFLMALANFWGLFLVITFMGFGLVSIPRKLWRRGDLELELAKIENRAMAYKDKAYDSALELSETLNEAQLVSTRVNPTDDLRYCVDQIMEHCSQVSQLSRLPAQTAAVSSRVPVEITETYLAGLHNRIKDAVLKEGRDRWRWTRSARRAFFLQDAIKSRANPRRQISSTLAPWSHRGMAMRSAAWWWYIALRPAVFCALSVAAALLSIIILWSELTFNMASSHISAVHYLLRTMGLSYLTIECTSIVAIAYMCLCAYSSVMKLRIFNIYSLESHHHTNERSLLFCGAYLCRLMFPLCYNFLNMAGSGFAGGSGDNDDDGSSSEVTEFARFMDRIDLVPVLGEQSNRIIPVLIMVPAALALFNVHGRVIEHFSIDRVTPSTQSTDSHEEELGPLCLPQEEGRGLLMEARLLAEREQGAADNTSRHTPRYTSAGSPYSSHTNLRAHAASVGAVDDATASSGRGLREWYLGRSSFDHARDDVSAELSNDHSDILATGDHAHHHYSQGRRPFGNYSSHASLIDIADGNASSGGGSSNGSGNINGNGNGNSNAGGSNVVTGGVLGHGGAGLESHSDSNDSSSAETSGGHTGRGSNTLSPRSALKAAGGAARFGRLLPARQGSQLSKTRSNFNAGRPSNVTRLRPSSRQSSRNNYASDEGTYSAHLLSPRGGDGLPISPNSLRAAAQTQTGNQPLVLSPSSPGRMPNPWVDSTDTRPHIRRHALSDTSAQPRPSSND
ncbi:hypothetical protein GGI11_004610 [Coemansia sp. RSA 2049]|nr:hypothetical protein GGI11_004610 [Coemansia sp. RSA 2049]